MKYNALAEQFWAQGYVMLEGFFDEHLMDTYDQLIVDHFGSEPDYLHNEEFLEKASTDVIPWFPQQEGILAFDVVENDKRLQILTEAILGEGWRSLYCMTMFSKQGSKGQAWHQDCAPEDANKFNMNRLVYSSDITADIGGQTLVVPGSHLRGELTVGDVSEEFSNQLVLSPGKGTLVLLHGHTWHSVRPVTGKYRVSTNYRSMPKGTPDDITDVCVYRNMRYRFSTEEVVEDRYQA
jgi:ectoine hydroxylase